MAMVTCPICGLSGAAGSFCEMGCGRLPEVAATETNPTPAEPPKTIQLDEPPPLSNVSPLPDVPPLPELPKLGGSEWLGAAPRFGSAQAQPKAPTPAKPITVPQGMPFGLAYTAPETMWKGENSVVVFRFRSSGDHFSDLTLILRNGGDELGRQALGRRPGDAERTFRFNVRPRFAGGCIDLSVDIVCQRDGAEGAEIYSAGFSVVVKNEQQQTINVHDINIGTGSAIYQGLNFSNPSIEDHARSAMKTIDGELQPELVASPRKLSLLSGDKVVQLLAVADGEVLTFGRLSSTTVPMRVYDRETGQLDRPKSDIISGVHIRLQPYEGRKVRVFDGCEEKPSSNGTLCGEMLISRDGHCTLGPGKHQLTMGANPNVGKAVGMGVEVHGTSDGLFGFTLTRDDGADQTVLCILRSVPFGTGGATVGWDGCSFVFTEGNGSRKNLIPGMSVTVDGVAYEVCVHRKCYL